jgi:hypothetical protein
MFFLLVCVVNLALWQCFVLVSRLASVQRSMRRVAVRKQNQHHALQNSRYQNRDY